MSLLATLLAKKQNRAVATLTVATDATHEKEKIPTVARVATVTVASLGNEKKAASDAIDLSPVTDIDRWCWPHSLALNSKDIDIFIERMVYFTDRGVSYDEAERLTDKLVIRDREGDDRQLCLECMHLQGRGRWRCGNGKVVTTARNFLSNDFVLFLQRCDGFVELHGENK